MAIPHLNAKVISRGKGQSAIAAAAYRSGERLTDEQTGDVKEYKARAQRILFEGMFAPANAPDWARDRNAFWNAVEQREGQGQGSKPAQAQFAREIEIALPHELTDQQREWLVKDFVREQFTRKGFVADVAIHAPDGKSDARNFHAHVMVSMRTVDENGFAAKKDRTQNEKQQLRAWRQEWEHLQNRHLERHGHEVRIDMRTLKAQGIEREPQIHVGVVANAMQERGLVPESKIIIDEKFFSNDERVINYPAIDGGKSRLQANEEIILRNVEREEERRRQPVTNSQGMDWTDRAGMAAQMDSAMIAAAKANEKAASPPPPTPEKTEREKYNEAIKEMTRRRTSERERDGGLER